MYNNAGSMQKISADIIGHWKTKAVWINGKRITLPGFLQDLQNAADEPDEHLDIINECKGVSTFSWGAHSKETNSLSLACCFYLKVKWVLCRFFLRELAESKQTDLQLHFDNDQLDAGYRYSEELFAKEFTDFMGKLGAVPIDENDTKN
jgi:hypothetical protein